MCDSCGEAAKLIRQAVNAGGTGQFSWVEFTFPNGKPVLKTRRTDGSAKSRPEDSQGSH